MPGHGRPRRDAGPQGPRARRGLRALACGGLAALALGGSAAPVLAAASDPYCTGSYATEVPPPGAPPLRFGVDPELAGSVGVSQGQAMPLDEAKDIAELHALTPPGKELVLRVNRLFWSDGEDGIKHFQAIIAAHDKAGFDSELQVRYHPASGDEGDIAKWTAYVRHVVDVFGADRHVVAMTITNEVNLSISQNTSDGAYSGASDALIKGIEAARAEADRIGRGDMKFGFTYAYRWNPDSDKAFWDAIGAGGAAFRAALGFVGVDIYPGTFYPPTIAPTSSPGQEMLTGLATVRRCFMANASLPVSIPIWITENGYDSGAGGDDAGQSAALEDMVKAAASVSGVDGVTDYRWFNLRDNQTGSSALFDTTGLLHDDYTPKPAFAALRALIATDGADAPAPAAAAAKPPTVVSLEFDDADADQARVPALLAGHGVHGTFFVPSGLVGRHGHLTWSQLRRLQRAGNEVGGHTVHHRRLTTLSSTRARHEVCDDRRRLQAHGLGVTNFAYPDGVSNARVESIVRGCGYRTGRRISGVQCRGCPFAETLPPAHPFATRTPPAPIATTPVRQLRVAVAGAQAHGGGWIQLVFHHVCDDCGHYAITPSALAGFVNWLAHRRGVSVRTVALATAAGR